jgi:hypothetical protein
MEKAVTGEPRTFVDALRHHFSSDETNASTECFNKLADVLNGYSKPDRLAALATAAAYIRRWLIKDGLTKAQANSALVLAMELADQIEAETHAAGTAP